MLDRLLITTILLVALPASSSAQSGAELVRDLGCGACHQGIPSPDAIRESAPPLPTCESCTPSPPRAEASAAKGGVSLGAALRRPPTAGWRSGRERGC